MKAKLVDITGGAQSSEINLRLPVIIGRGRSAGVMLPHSLISRQHCELYEAGGQLLVRDLGSMNGTLVNRCQIEQPTVLRAGDNLTLGPLTFRLDVLDATTTKSDTGDETAVASKTEVASLKNVPSGVLSNPELNLGEPDPSAAASRLAELPAQAGSEQPATVKVTPPTERAPHAHG